MHNFRLEASKTYAMQKCSDCQVLLKEDAELLNEQKATYYGDLIVLRKEKNNLNRQVKKLEHEKNLISDKLEKQNDKVVNLEKQSKNHDGLDKETKDKLAAAIKKRDELQEKYDNKAKECGEIKVMEQKLIKQD